MASQQDFEHIQVTDDANGAWRATAAVTSPIAGAEVYVSNTKNLASWLDGVS